ncbi:ANTAR domain-containing protein [Streptomyces sp. TRM66268-LWL]|uniref:ANTAR domain-containing protein n=2 Tax=Streptomyces polyasparticus TaxID=2767826 RepID=A0ABR7SEL5_9ACTN|nr:ANTAR domain-containing protein [Streptomyces polyasparticus]
MRCGTDQWDPDQWDIEALREQLARTTEEVRHLRARDRSRPAVAMAQGILLERYRLRDADQAFVLLRHTSQRCNVKMRSLVDAVLHTPRPDSMRELWFPGRVRQRAPQLPALRLNGDQPPHRSGVLRVVLSQVLAIAGTDMGNVQLADPAQRGLRLEHHTGHPDDFVDYFAFVGETGTACGAAATSRALVTVRNVAEDPVFTDGARRTILEAGSRAVHSVPLIGTDGACVGMVSAHLPEPSGELAQSQSALLTEIGRQAGRWLAWYEDTLVRNALEFLHALGRRPELLPQRGA